MGCTAFACVESAKAPLSLPLFLSLSLPLSLSQTPAPGAPLTAALLRLSMG